MNVYSSSRASTVARLLSNEGKTFALERQHTGIFDNLVLAARRGFPRAQLVAAQDVLKGAQARGETLSHRSAELLASIEHSLRVPALQRAKLH